MQCYGLASEGSLEEAYGEAKTAMLAAGKTHIAAIYLAMGSMTKICTQYLPTETAFFDPSILELLYFPDDQK